MKKWKLLLVLVPALVVADQVTKFMAVDRLTTAFEEAGAVTLGERVAAYWRLDHLEHQATAPYVVIGPVWRMHYVENPGAAWGILRGASEGVRNALFGAVIVVAIAFILTYYRKVGERQRWLQLALAFVLSGAIGNGIDRAARSYVVDFIAWHWWNRPDLQWPTFNIADSLIVVGVAMLIVHPGAAREPASKQTGDRKRSGNTGAPSRI
jgi:signal peptidase II